VLINGNIRVVYDALDGFNWITGNRQENLDYFRDNFSPDFYFKRSFNPILQQYCNQDTKVLPLGLNFALKVSHLPSPQERLKNTFKQILKVLGKPTILYHPIEELEYLPYLNSQSKVLFILKLWNPNEIRSNKTIEELHQMNERRVELIRACSSHFKDDFIGGIIDDAYSRTIAPDLVLPKSFTTKEQFLKHIKMCNICIATEGLHQSIGWKFAEFVAHSRAIVTESLSYQVPGDFAEGKNFILFKEVKELINVIESLRSDKELTHQMMLQNYLYYQGYLRPDMLILNTLKHIV
jgi:hypothetical protein